MEKILLSDVSHTKKVLCVLSTLYMIFKKQTEYIKWRMKQLYVLKRVEWNMLSLNAIIFFIFLCFLTYFECI